MTDTKSRILPKRGLWKPGDRIVYIRFDNISYAPSPLAGKVAKFDCVEWRVISDHQQAVNALLAGEIGEPPLAAGRQWLRMIRDRRSSAARKISTNEPFRELFNQGMIVASSYRDAASLAVRKH